jgi:hypothetical protein
VNATVSSRLETQVQESLSPTPERQPGILLVFSLLQLFRQFLNLLLHFFEGFREVSAGLPRGIGSGQNAL